MSTTPPKNSEMIDIVATVVGTLNEVITSLRAEITEMTNNEIASRRRISIYLAVLGIVAFCSIGGIFLTYEQSKDIKNLVGQNNTVVGSVFDSVSCVLLIPNDKRTNDNIKACRDKQLGISK
jgi:hypothetical protein